MSFVTIIHKPTSFGILQLGMFEIFLISAHLRVVSPLMLESLVMLLQLVRYGEISSIMNHFLLLQGKNHLIIFLMFLILDCEHS